METLKLTNGNETFMLSQIVCDNLGAAHAKDSRGSGYFRCREAACDHEHAPEGATVWHDDEYTEELWEA
jgi:hypothetical protein